MDQENGREGDKLRAASALRGSVVIVVAAVGIAVALAVAVVVIVFVVIAAAAGGVFSVGSLCKLRDF